MIRLTKNEESILQLFWQLDRPLTRGEIIELTPNRQWTPASVHSFLNKMMDKGVIKVAGFERTGKRYGRTYCAVYTQQELAALQVYAAGRADEVTDYPAVIAALMKAAPLNEETVAQLEQLVAEKRAQLQGE